MICSWENVLLSENASIKDALEVINNESLRVVIIVNASKELLGTVTDGDIRRAFLRGEGLDSKVIHVMNPSPVSVQVGTSRGEMLEMMNQLDILFIPILEGKKVAGLETLHYALVVKESYSNPVFIMAGGFGTRLRPLTDNCPKPMLKVGDKPILETVIRSFINAGFNNFYISTHYMPEQIHTHFGDGSSFGVNIYYVHEDAPLGTGGALGLLPKEIVKDEPIIMMNGDVLTKIDFRRLLEFHMENDAVATMCVRDYEYQIPYGVINGEGNQIVSMEEKPIQRFFVNAGIYVVSPEVIKSVPENHRIDMPTLLEQHINNKNKVLMFPIHEYWLDIGRMDDFHRAQADIMTLGMD